jgi:hypothetical protein
VARGFAKAGNLRQSTCRDGPCKKITATFFDKKHNSTRKTRMNLAHKSFFIIAITVTGTWLMHAADKEIIADQFVKIHFSVPEIKKHLVSDRGTVRIPISIKGTADMLLNKLKETLEMQDANIGLMCEGHMQTFLSGNETLNFTITYVAVKRS